MQPEGVMRKMDDFTDFMLNQMPIGVLVYNQKMEHVYANKQAKSFFQRYQPPEELFNISKRIFEAIKTSGFRESFPGEIYVSKKLENSTSNWTFKFFVYQTEEPLVGIFIIEETISNKLNMNHIRSEYKLTRRETDVLRRLLNGLKNQEIADDLEISEQTVKDHLSNIYMKTGVENRFALIRSLINTPDRPGTQ
jgi:DNA-binding NarL/FixJ family response regulator